MNLVGIETIIPYVDTHEFKIYKYNNEIDMCDKDLFVCDMKVVINRINSIYEGKIEKEIETLVLIKNLKVDKLEIEDELKDFVFNEIYEEKMIRDDIEIMFIGS